MVNYDPLGGTRLFPNGIPKEYIDNYNNNVPLTKEEPIQK